MRLGDATTLTGEEYERLTAKSIGAYLFERRGLPYAIRTGEDFTDILVLTADIPKLKAIGDARRETRAMELTIEREANRKREKEAAERERIIREKTEATKKRLAAQQEAYRQSSRVGEF
jgi:hypothetical protein